MKRRHVAERAVHEIRLAGRLDRHALEALWLELRRLGKEHGVDIEVRIERTAVRRSA